MADEEDRVYEELMGMLVELAKTAVGIPKETGRSDAASLSWSSSWPW